MCVGNKEMIDNLEEYVDAYAYEAEYVRYTGDFDLNIKAHGDVLDLACGTGR
jgi:hypothetical protein